MTKLRKWLVAGFMTVITLCVSMGSALLNVTQTIFSKLKVHATTDYAYSNSNSGTTLTEGKVVSVEGLAKTATLNDDQGVSIPKAPKVFALGDEALTPVSPDEVVVEIKNPYGDYLVNRSILNTSQITDDDANKQYILKPTQVGMYTVQYAVKTGGVWTLSDIYQINVRAEAYKYDILPNDPIVMPKKLDSREKDTDDNLINKNVDISLPIFYDAEGKQIKSFVISSTAEHVYVAEYVTLNNVFFDVVDGKQNPYPTVLTEDTRTAAIGKNIYEKYSTYQIKRVPVMQFNASDIKYGVVVEVNVPGEDVYSNAETIANTENLLKLDSNLFVEDTCFYAKNPFSFEAKSGKNFVQYKLCDNAMTKYATPYAYTEPHVIEATNAYDSTNIALGASTPTVIKSSDTSIGEKIYLPAVNVVDNNENKNALSAYYYYNVRYVTKDGFNTEEKNVVMGIDEDGVYFIPKEQGSYNISYNARDFYNNQDENYAKYDYTITVNDRKAPTLYFVDAYDYVSYTKDLAEKAEDKTYYIPTKTVIAKDNTNPTEIAIPALYAHDTVTDIEKLKIEISITSDGAFINGSKTEKQDKYYSIDVLDRSNASTDYEVEVKKPAPSTDKEKLQIIYYKDANYTDYYVKDSKFYYSNDEEITDKEDLMRAKASQTAYIKLDSRLFGEGKYTVEYSVSDASQNSNQTAKTFTFELVEESLTTPLDEVAPTVDFGSISIGNVVENEEISISLPTIKDNVDTKTFNKYYVLVEGQTDEAVPVAVKKYLEIKPKDNKLTFKTSDVIDGSTSIYALANTLQDRSFKIIAFAFDDIADQSAEALDPTTINIANIKDYKNIGYGSYTVTLLAEEDETTPFIASRTNFITTENDAYNQFATVSVNGIKFYDNTSTARVIAQVFDSKGNSYPVEEIRFENEEDFEKNYYVKKLVSPKTINGKAYNYEYNYPGIKFPANKADSYTINYTVIDNGGNSVSYSFVLRAATDKEAPVIEGVLGTYETKELGDTFYLNTLTSKDNLDENVTYSFNVVGENVGNKTSWFNTETKQFTPYAADTYTITVRATDAKGNYSTRTFVIKFVDSKKPTLTIVNGSTSVISVREKENNGVDGIDWKNKFPTIELPTFSVTDYNQDKVGFANVLTATGTLTITTPDNDSYTIDINGVIEGENPLNIQRVGSGDNYKYTFTPTSRGHYVVKYTGEDKAGNAVEEPKQIDVYIGDTEQPVIALNDTLSNILKKGFTLGENAQIVIDPKVILSKAADDSYRSGASGDGYVNVTDNFGFKDSNVTDGKVFTRVSVQVVDSNNSTVAQQDNNDGSGLIYYTFDKAGTYTITFTVTDGVGNSGKISRTFKVSANAATATDTAKILGTVLIVVSIAILAGVVIYFVKGTKMLPKRKKSKKQPRQEEKKDN